MSSPIPDGQANNIVMDGAPKTQNTNPELLLAWREEGAWKGYYATPVRLSASGVIGVAGTNPLNDRLDVRDLTSQERLAVEGVCGGMEPQYRSEIFKTGVLIDPLKEHTEGSTLVVKDTTKGLIGLVKCPNFTVMSFKIDSVSDLNALSAPLLVIARRMSIVRDEPAGYVKRVYLRDGQWYGEYTDGYGGYYDKELEAGSFDHDIVDSMQRQYTASIRRVTGAFTPSSVVREKGVWYGYHRGLRKWENLPLEWVLTNGDHIQDRYQVGGIPPDKCLELHFGNEKWEPEQVKVLPVTTASGETPVVVPRYGSPGTILGLIAKLSERKLQADLANPDLRDETVFAIYNGTYRPLPIDIDLLALYRQLDDEKVQVNIYYPDWLRAGLQEIAKEKQ